MKRLIMIILAGLAMFALVTPVSAHAASNGKFHQVGDLFVRNNSASNAILRVCTAALADCIIWPGGGRSMLLVPGSDSGLGTGRGAIGADDVSGFQIPRGWRVKVDSTEGWWDGRGLGENARWVRIQGCLNPGNVTCRKVLLLWRGEGTR